MIALERGRYRARMADGPLDMDAVLALRGRVFRGGLVPDGDAFDTLCSHLMIEEVSGGLVATGRMMVLSGAEVVAGYAAQFYDLGPLTVWPGKMLELGRFALDPGWHDPDILRLAWAALARVVTERDVGLLFGCTSFKGAAPEAHLNALALLAERHVGPAQWRPHAKGEVFPFAEVLAGHPVATETALAEMPTLLRSYLQLGGWVSDHAVADADLDTLHVFTAVEVARIPPGRLRALTALAGF
ncbi:GNAT family N-acetyltransferase [Tabrizicola sp. BL-A-41-H6]|uniref:GNAT family N-acetyltransferase n=1 Tax=Tabrizicola sp. BL-A-41-H6 TaxID=3421107 RepID=UPI003D67FED4